MVIHKYKILRKDLYFFLKIRGQCGQFLNSKLEKEVMKVMIPIYYSAKTIENSISVKQFVIEGHIFCNC